MKKIKICFIILQSVLVFLVTSCSSDNDNVDGDDTNIVIDEDFETNSQDASYDNAIAIKFSADNTVTIDNPFESNGVSIAQNGGNVVITSTVTDTEINYVLSGNTSDGSVKVYSTYKFGLILNGVSIISTDGPAINIQSGKKVSVTVVDGTSNRLVDSNTHTAYEDEDMKAAFFSEGQLVFSGNGSLLVYGRYKHAICSDDYIQIKEGNLTIAETVSDGIHANDYIRIDGGTVNVTSAGDGIDCEEGYIVINGGSVTVNSIDNAIVASYKGTDTSITPYIKIVDGSIALNTTGDGAKGLKSKGDVSISGGSLTILTSGSAYYDSSDKDIKSSSGIKCDGNLVISGTSIIQISSTGAGGKGISADGTITFNGGTTNVTTSGDLFKYGSDDTAAKAIKSDSNLTVNDGTIVIKTSKEEAEGLESKATLVINGGTVEIEAYDDCINASNHIEITGGYVYCYSATNDGIDSNGTLTISGGVIVSSGAGQPEAGIDCDNNTFKVTGGTIVSIGGSTSKPTSGVSTQRSVVYSANMSSANIVHIQSLTGVEVLTFKLPRTYNQSSTLLFSSPDLLSNTSYTIYLGGSISGGTDFHGLFSNSTYTKGTSASTFTTSSMVTTIGTSGNGGR